MDQEHEDFAEFYEHSRDGCFRAVLASVGDRHQAEELVAEAFARAWASWRKVRKHPAPQAWIVRTALNTHVSWWRRRRREVTWEALDRTADPAVGLSGTDGGGHGTAVEAALMTALRSLPVRQREVVALRVFLDLDTRATAAALGIAPGTVQAHLHRATKALRAELESLTEQEAKR